MSEEQKCCLHLHSRLPWKLCNFTVINAGHRRTQLSILHAQLSMPLSYLLSLHISHFVQFSQAVKWLKFSKSLFHIISLPARWEWPITVPSTHLPVCLTELIYIYICLWSNISGQRGARLTVLLKPVSCKHVVPLTMPVCDLVCSKSVGSGKRHIVSLALPPSCAEPEHVCTQLGSFKWSVQSMAKMFNIPLHSASLGYNLTAEI